MLQNPLTLTEVMDKNKLRCFFIYAPCIHLYLASSSLCGYLFFENDETLYTCTFI